MDEELATGLGEWEIAQFVQAGEVELGDEVGKSQLLAGTRFCIEPIDEIEDVEEATACSAADQGAGKPDGEVGFSCGGPSDQNDIVPLGEEGPGRELAHQLFTDR